MMTRPVLACCLAILALVPRAGWAQAAAALRDKHTLALYDFRGGDDGAMVDLCGGGSLESEGDTPPALQRGAGLLLDGSTRLAGALPPLKAPFTIEALVRLDGSSPGGVHGLFEQLEFQVRGCRVGIVGQSGNRLMLQVSDPVHRTMVNVMGRTGLEVGTWYHVAATCDTQALRVWVNGKEDGALAWAGGIAPARGGMTIGCLAGPKYYLVGSIGTLRLSDIARTSFPHGENPIGPAAGPASGISARYPEVSAYFFAAGKPFPVTCAITNDSDREVTYTLRLETPLLDGEAPAIPPVRVRVPVKAKAEAAIPVRLDRRGMYLPTLVAQCEGAEAQRRKLPPFAIIEPLPPLAKIPAASHFGGQPTHSMPGSDLVGMKWNRFWDYDTIWAKIEPERGKFAWEKTDQLLAEAKARGEEVLWCLCFTPRWASTIPDRETVLKDPRLKGQYGDAVAGMLDSGQLAWQYPPRDLADWRRYVAEMVKRYGDRVKYWEVWNEANNAHFLGTPKEYFEVLKAAYETIKAIDPKATVIGIAGDPGWMPFTEEVAKLGGLKYMDVLSYHDYTYDIPEAFGCDRKVAETRGMMRRYGRVLPVWDTEVGNPIPPKVGGRPMTWDEFQENLGRAADGKATLPFFARCQVTRRGKDLDARVAGICPTTEDRAARYLVRQFVLEMSEGMERFNLHYGAAISHGKLPLLTGISHAMMAKALGTAAFVRRIPTGSPSCRAYLFRGEGGPVAVCWTTEERERLVLLSRSRRLPTADLFGNPGEARGDGRRVVLNLTDSPTYIFGWPGDARAWQPLTVSAPTTILARQSFRVRAGVQNTQAEAMSGKLRLTGIPSGWRVEPAEAALSVPAGSKAVREFMVDPPANVRRGTLTPAMLLEAGEAAWSMPIPLMVAQPIACPTLPADARVDGDLSEWTGTPALLNTPAQVVIGKPSPMFEKTAGTWWGPDDLSARLWFARSPDSLWVALDVKDDSLVPPQLVKEGYRSDCVELFLDGRSREGQASTSYGPGVAHLLISPPDAQGACRVAVCQGRVNGITAAGKRTAAGYTLEARIPLARDGFPEFAVQPGALLGFDLALDDADAGGERKVQMVWQGSAANYQDTSLFGRLRF